MNVCNVYIDVFPMKRITDRTVISEALETRDLLPVKRVFAVSETSVTQPRHKTADIRSSLNTSKFELKHTQSSLCGQNVCASNIFLF